MRFIRKYVKEYGYKRKGAMQSYRLLMACQSSLLRHLSRVSSLLGVSCWLKKNLFYPPSSLYRSKLLDMAGPGMSVVTNSDVIAILCTAAPVTDRLCPGCGSLLLPSPSVRLRTLSRKTLRKMRRKKKVIWLTTPLSQANTYVVRMGTGEERNI